MTTVQRDGTPRHHRDAAPHERRNRRSEVAA
jgi:hypothetical protein